MRPLLVLTPPTVVQLAQPVLITRLLDLYLELVLVVVWQQPVLVVVLVVALALALVVVLPVTAPAVITELAMELASQRLAPRQGSTLITTCPT